MVFGGLVVVVVVGVGVGVVVGVGEVGGGEVGVTTWDTTIVTVLPRCCWVPPAGFWESTKPGLLVACCCCTLTVNPLLASWLWAALCDRPTTLGTVLSELT